MAEYKFRENTVILIGDTHSTNITYELLNIRIPNRSDVVHIGDGGWGFGNADYAINNAKSWLSRINRLCQDLDIILYHIIGNHDNPDVWNLENASNVIFVKSGDVGIFPNGKKCLFVGGGISVDRYTRKEGVDYWKGEVTPILEHVEKVDIVFSHDCPEHFNHSTASLPRNFGWYCERDTTLLDDCLKQRLNMTDICARSEAKLIIGGHFHNSMKQEIDGVKYRCLDINELYEFDADEQIIP